MLISPPWHVKALQLWRHLSPRLLVTDVNLGLGGKIYRKSPILLVKKKTMVFTRETMVFTRETMVFTRETMVSGFNFGKPGQLLWIVAQTIRLLRPRVKTIFTGQSDGVVLRSMRGLQLHLQNDNYEIWIMITIYGTLIYWSNMYLCIWLTLTTCLYLMFNTLYNDIINPVAEHPSQKNRQPNQDHPAWSKDSAGGNWECDFALPCPCRGWWALPPEIVPTKKGTKKPSGWDRSAEGGLICWMFG